MILLCCHFSKLCVLMKRCKYQSTGLLNQYLTSEVSWGVRGGHWRTYLAFCPRNSLTRDRCSRKGTGWIAGYPHALPVPFLFAEAMSFIHKWEMRGSKISRVDGVALPL